MLLKFLAAMFGFCGNLLYSIFFISWMISIEIQMHAAVLQRCRIWNISVAYQWCKSTKTPRSGGRQEGPAALLVVKSKLYDLDLSVLRSKKGTERRNRRSQDDAAKRLGIFISGNVLPIQSDSHRDFLRLQCLRQYISLHDKHQ